MSTQTKEVRLDEVLLKKVDQPSAYVKYIGRADGFDALTSEARWQIERVTILSGVETVEYANYGSYRNIWDNRASYFGAFTAPVGVSGPLTVGTSAVAIRVGGADLADRKSVILVNTSSNTLYWGFDNTVTTSTGVPLAAGDTQTWCVEGDVPTEVVPTLYVIAGSAGNSSIVAESP